MFTQATVPWLTSAPAPPCLAVGGSSAITPMLAALVANTLGDLTGPAALGHALAGIVNGTAVLSRLTTLTPGVLAGELALLSNQPRSADVVARTAARCLLIDAAANGQPARGTARLGLPHAQHRGVPGAAEAAPASTTIASLEA